MGNNTVALLLNDFASEWDHYPESIAMRVKEGLAGGQGSRFGQAIELLPSCHADGDQIVMAGGNRITPIAVLRNCQHNEEALLKALADRLGYSLRKKAPRQ